MTRFLGGAQPVTVAAAPADKPFDLSEVGPRKFEGHHQTAPAGPPNASGRSRRSLPTSGRGARAKIAISLALEVLSLVDRHAEGRSRSRCIEEELLRALRAREWERLAATFDTEETAEAVHWAEVGFAAAHDTLARDEPTRRPARRARGRRSR